MQTDKMKLSFSTLGCPNYNMDEIIEMAVKNNYQGVEIRAVSGTVQISGLDEFKGSGLAETAKKLKNAGLEVACLGTSIGFSKADAEHQKKNLEDAKVNMEIANALDCKYIRTFGGPLPPTQGFVESLKWIKEGYQKLCDLVNGAGILPLLETHDDFSTSARIKEVIDGVPNGKIGVVWDIVHSVRFGEAPEVTYNTLKDYIYHTHIKDSLEFSPSGTDFPLTGEGKIPIAECLSLLSAGGYDGYYSFEWEKLWHPEIPGPEVAIPHFAENIHRIASKSGV